MLAEGKIADTESPYCAPILFVPKPDGSLRLCVDYSNLNKEKRIEIVTRDFYWKGLAEWIREYVRCCDQCQPSKSRRHAKYRLLQPLEVAYAYWSSIWTDYITQLP